MSYEYKGNQYRDRRWEMMRGTPPPTWENACLKLSEENRELQERIKRLEEALDSLTLVVGLTPIAGNKDALQEAVDLARAALQAKEAKP